MPLHNVPKTILKALIGGYAYFISPLTGAKCRFYPTCSAYAMEAIGRHGALKGVILGIKRILKCHPWHKGQMLDSVPASIDWNELIGYNRKAPQQGCQCHTDKEN
jgi:putative membrane protein insertion efficiency factor